PPEKEKQGIGETERIKTKRFTDSPIHPFTPECSGVRNSGGGDLKVGWQGEEEFDVKPNLRREAAFKEGGFYVLRDNTRFAFIRCGKHKDRPSQADNLHLDIWVNGKNILRDAGSFKYNTTPEDIKYFMGTISHNTVMLGNYDQMEKGEHFIWYYWSQAVEANLSEDDEWLIFKGKIHAFKHIKPNIFHTRIVKQHKKQLLWEIEDVIEIPPPGIKLSAKQIWNFAPDFSKDGFKITSRDKNGNEIEGKERDAFYSSYYGIKEPSRQLVFETNGEYFKTVIFYEDTLS
ncbi:MAG: hypothetical protein FVQ77_08025, partial [Cytophagales bacterium]|nr:hypothetical protein [Cytophagales bacterium]